MSLIGIDPGATHTAIVVRTQTELLDRAYVHRAPDMQRQRYCIQVCDIAKHLIERHEVRQVTIEAVVRPSPHIRITNVEPLLGTAMTFGALMRACEDWPLSVTTGFCHPNRFGQAPIECYPEAIRRPKTGMNAHYRAAWDIAFALHDWVW